MAYILLYVDDIILTASSNALRCSIIALLSYEFAMKNLGRLNYFLGIVVTIHKGGMFLSQRNYTVEIIERAGMSSCKPTLTPIYSKPKLSANSNKSCRGPSYLTFTRPNISYAVQQICLHMHNSRIDHFNALKRIIRYVKGTLDHGLHLYPFSFSTLVS
uniref:Reverse transcriptase Ty1/copia-type domain-containing protein n=1 Tax=Solanum lycopersicum TaxID=4081 RepID=A0A3Q7IWP7_SOLLC